MINITVGGSGGSINLQDAVIRSAIEAAIAAGLQNQADGVEVTGLQETTGSSSASRMLAAPSSTSRMLKSSSMGVSTTVDGRDILNLDLHVESMLNGGSVLVTRRNLSGDSSNSSSSTTRDAALLVDYNVLLPRNMRDVEIDGVISRVSPSGANKDQFSDQFANNFVARLSENATKENRSGGSPVRRPRIYQVKGVEPSGQARMGYSNNGLTHGTYFRSSAGSSQSVGSGSRGSGNNNDDDFGYAAASGAYSSSMQRNNGGMMSSTLISVVVAFVLAAV
jgi:hypothetical protein